MRKNKRIGRALAALLLLLLGLLTACQSEKTPSVRAELQLAYASEEDWQNDTEAPRYQEPNAMIAPQLVLTTTAPVSQLRLVALTVTEEEVPPTPPVTSDDVKPQPSGSGGGGCSAGFGALALLAALPLLRMRKK